MAEVHPNAQKTNPEKVSRNILLFGETETIMEVEFQVERLFGHFAPILVAKKKSSVRCQDE